MKLFKAISDFLMGVKRKAPQVSPVQPTFAADFEPTKEKTMENIEGVRLRHPKKFQAFSEKLVGAGLRKGWITPTEDNVLVFRDADGKPSAAYKILHEPGYQCCHCRNPFPSGEAAFAHVVQKHPARPSPDRSNPMGYKKSHQYDCVFIK